MLQYEVKTTFKTVCTSVCGIVGPKKITND